MINFLMSLTHMLAIQEAAGGLFDFNATLPFMAIQFILLTVILTFLFYKPVANTLEQRETFINTNLASATEKLLKADELCKQYEEQLKEAKANSQTMKVAWATTHGTMIGGSGPSNSNGSQKRMRTH